MVDIRLKCPFTLLCVAPSRSGKTHWIRKLLLNSNVMFDKKVDHIYYFYKENQDIYEEMKREFHNITFLQTMCTMEFLRENCTLHANSVCVIDDLLFSCTSDSSEMFTVGSSRYNVNIIMIVQNLFERANPCMRTISLNSRYFTLIKNVRDSSSVINLAKQVFPYNGTFFVDAYRDATKLPYSYLFLDLSQECPEVLRVRTNIFGENNEPVKVYVRKEGI